MCGVLAFIGVAPDAEAVVSALELIRHRGQDGFGFWVHDRDEKGVHCAHFRQTGKGVTETARQLLVNNPHTFIAHWRYATRGGGGLENMHPLLIDNGKVAIAHNGQFQMSSALRNDQTSDSVLFARSVEEQPSGALGKRIFSALGDLGGAFALVASDGETLVAARDRFAIRPLFWARYSGGIAVSSEVPTLLRLGCQIIEDVEPGSVVDWTPAGPDNVWMLPAARPAPCSFEHIYFHAADGRLDGRPVYWLRYLLGRQLAQEAPTLDAAVVSVPKSADAFAHGFADTLGLPLEPAISVRPEAARTFIAAESSRADTIRRKYVVHGDIVAGKSLVLVDDSLVRGSTLAYLVKELRAAGAAQVHARIGSPPFRHPCYFGVDVPDRTQLICDGRNIEDVCALLDLDSLSFLSLAGLHRALGANICTGCFSGTYPEGALDSVLEDAVASAAGR